MARASPSSAIDEYGAIGAGMYDSILRRAVIDLCQSGAYFENHDYRRAAENLSEVADAAARLARLLRGRISSDDD